MRYVFLLFLLAQFACSPQKQTTKLALPNVLSDHAVLQRQRPIPVWGVATPHEKIKVHFRNQTKSTKTNAHGKWRLDLDPEEAGGPFELVVEGKWDRISQRNMLVGEVWFCSGQSNMAFTVKNAVNADAEIADGDQPLIRHIKVEPTFADTPQENSQGRWKECKSTTVDDFTAVGYFFAKNMVKDLNMPVGIIHCSWGGTNIETWVSSEAISQVPDYQDIPPLKEGLILKTRRGRNKAFFDFWEKAGVPENAIADNRSEYVKPDFDDSNWPTLDAPGKWEGAIPEFDGVLYYRKEFDLPESVAASGITLHLAKIDDADETWVNGEKVGETNVWDADRVYQVPAKILKPGRNVVAVRVTDTGGGGGIWGDPKALKINGKDGFEKSLVGQWRIRAGKISTSSEVHPNMHPSLLFNGMVAPVIPYGIRGVLWYQGESNVTNAHQYRSVFPALIRDWRKHWGQGDLPFLFVQLSDWRGNYGNSEKGSEWAEVREAQLMALALPNTGMAVTIDIGDEEDIHPHNKQDVGKRLAALALAQVYDKKNVPCGPLFDKMEVQDGRAFLSFKNIGGGLVAKNGNLQGFEMAGEDQKFVPAKAIIEGGKVVVFSEKINAPLAVRYGWADHPPKPLNLFNEEGFPASPFRTDDWKGVTEGRKYKSELLGQ